MLRSVRHSLLVSGLAAFLLSCGGLRVSLVDSAFRRPSNVAVYFTVDGADGAPVPGLTAQSFHIYEDDHLVSEAESQQTIVNPEVASEHFTLLLVDMSGSISQTNQVPVVQQAATEFTQNLEQDQRVAVYAFDGSEHLHEITGFGSSGGASAGVSRLSGFHPQDPSTNLHGAIVEAMTVLDEAMSHSTVPLRVGTLVVFTDGTDRAARVTRQQMDHAIDQAPYDVFAIGVGTEIDEGTLSDVGRDGYVLVQDSSAMVAAFQRISERVKDLARRFYLLSYCSPARAGHHRVTVEAVTQNGSGKLSYDFDATGFTPNCNPAQPPPFAVGNARAVRATPRQQRGQRIQVHVQAGGGGGGGGASVGVAGNATVPDQESGN